MNAASIIKRDGTKEYICFRDTEGDIVAIDIDMVINIYMSSDKGGTTMYKDRLGDHSVILWDIYYSVVMSYKEMFKWVADMKCNDD